MPPVEEPNHAMKTPRTIAELQDEVARLNDVIRAQAKALEKLSRDAGVEIQFPHACHGFEGLPLMLLIGNWIFRGIGSADRKLDFQGERKLWN